VTNDFIASAAQLACLLEASAPKPGNVSPGRNFSDASYEDFLASAAAIGPALASDLALGAMIHAAIRATHQWTRSNTNLGLVLLLAPLARAARFAARSSLPLEDAVHDVLANTTVEDAREVYAAIRLARPGGLGTASEQDVTAEPTIPLTDAMRLAYAHDSIAMEYAASYPITFKVGLPAVLAARAQGMSWEDTTVRTFLDILSAVPDTHVERKFGKGVAVDVSNEVERARRGGPEEIASFDRSLRQRGINPGTTADLTAAALYVALLTGAWDSR
jgi:triphosphoribosyl-dephospho-CoA synthase